MNIENQSYPLSAKSKPSFFTILISLCVHLGFLLWIASISFSFPHLIKSKPTLTPYKEYTAYDAKRQASLNKTFSRFYPFITSKGRGNKTPSFENSGQLGEDLSSLKTSFSQGQDSYTLINTQKNALNLLALSTPTEKGNSLKQHIPANLFLKTPFLIEDALFVKDLIQKEKELNIEQAPQSVETNILSSHVATSSKDLTLNPFELDLNPSSSLSVDVIDLKEMQSDPLFAFTIDDKGSFNEKPLTSLEWIDTELEETPSDDLLLDLDDTKVLIKSQHFSHTVKCFKIKNSSHYLFEITLHPMPHFAFDILNQHFLFLMDRSNSIGKMAFQSYKRAVSFGLNLLPKNATFNVHVFDSTTQKLHLNPLPAVRKNLFKAKSYLETQEPGGLFASTDLFKALKESFTEDSHSLCNVILLSDGDTFITQSNQMKKLKEFIQSMPNKYVLHTVATGKNNNLALLNLLAKLNQGELLYKKDGSTLEKAFSSFIQSIIAPIAKDVLVTVVKDSKTQLVRLIIPKHRLSPLYASRPYRIYGITDELASFTLFLQGVGTDGVITIKKTINLKQTQQEPSILQELHMQKSLDHVETYIQDGDPSHLQKVNIFIPSFN